MKPFKRFTPAKPRTAEEPLTPGQVTKLRAYLIYAALLGAALGAIAQGTATYACSLLAETMQASRDTRAFNAGYDSALHEKRGFLAPYQTTSNESFNTPTP